jgi:hypothetical protein
MKTKIWLATVALSILVLTGQVAADTTEDFTRKTFVLTNSFYLTGKSGKQVAASPERYRYLIEKLNDAVNPAQPHRFNVIPLPAELLVKFREEMRQIPEMGGIDEALPELVRIVEEMLVPPILDRIQLEKDTRIEGVLTEAERKRLYDVNTQKYKMTRETLTQLMNSVFIYLPFLQVHQRVTGASDDGTPFVRYLLEGGVIIFKINVSETEDVSISTYCDSPIRRDGSGSANPNKRYGRYETTPGDQHAFEKAVEELEGELNLAIRECFPLGETIREVHQGQGILDRGTYVDFPRGRKSGVRIDDRYRISDVFSDGTETSVGHFVVVKVGDNLDNPSALSRGRMIRGKPAKGMVVKEFPRSGFDVDFRFRRGIPITLNSTSIPLADLDDLSQLFSEFSVSDNGYLRVSSATPVEARGSALEVNWRYYLRSADSIPGPQAFITAGFQIGRASLSNHQVFVNGSKADALWEYAFHLGLLKKFHFNPLTVGIEPRLGVQADSIAGTENQSHVYTGRFIPELLVHFEYPYREHIDVGLSIGYRSGSTTTWRLNEKGKFSFGGNATKFIGPKVSYSGLHFGLHTNIVF